MTISSLEFPYLTDRAVASIATDALRSSAHPTGYDFAHKNPNRATGLGFYLSGFALRKLDERFHYWHHLSNDNGTKNS